MRDEDKTKEQLIQELAELRKQLAETTGQLPKREDVKPEVVGDTDAEDARYGTEEPWLPIETKLVVGSITGGVIALIVLATMVNMFILGGH
jgi:hypothetical protein